VNKTQKFILAIFVPIIFFFIAVFIAKKAVDYIKQGDGSLFDNSLLPLAR